MHATEFLRQPDRGSLKPVYALAGDDAYLKRESRKAIVRAALGQDAGDELAVARFEGPRAGLADVLDELRTLPFLTPVRLVVIDEADPFVTAHRKELEEYVARPAATGVLVLDVGTWPSNTRLAKLVAQHGLSIDCKSPREAALGGLLADLARSRYDLRLEGDAGPLLIELVGPELALLVSELEKLATYVGERKTIGRADVLTMVGSGRIETIWKALEAATTGQAAAALDHLDRLLGSGEHPVGLLAAMTASLRKVHHAGLLRMAGVGPEPACREAGIPPYPGAIQATLAQHKHLGPARVSRLPDMLLRADLDLKSSSSLSPRTVLERLVLWLAQPRQEAPR